MKFNTIFIHIPKCGGSTLRDIMHREYGNAGEHVWVIHRTDNIPDFLALPEERRRKIKVLIGHGRYGLHKYLKGESLYITFEDPRLEGFELNDFSKIENLGKQSKKTIFIFDEIQNINGWEKYIRSANDRGIPVYISGSNASLLSRELGTRLTGRFKQFELFPFNYQEYLN